VIIIVTPLRQCLTETPNIQPKDIQRKASEIGLAISPGYISDIRKAFFGRTDNTERGEAAQ
jgi:hypothetical protein